MKRGGISAILATAIFAAGTAAAVVKPSAIVPEWTGAAPGVWTQDYEAALAAAQTDGKYAIVLFSGMWWCPHCQALEDNVLSTDAWRQYVEANGFYLSVIDFPYRDGYSNFCWLWDADYLADKCGGMTLEEGTNTVYRRYAVQDSFSVPGAQEQTVNLYDADGTVTNTITYHRVGYPTMIVVAPSGARAGRFSISKTAASLDYVTNRIEQIKMADAWDEADDFWSGATALAEPTCEDSTVSTEVHTLGITDKADWFAVKVSAGTGRPWSFRLVQENSGFEPARLAVDLYADPAGAPVASVAAESEAGDIELGAIIGKGTYYVKVRPANTLSAVAGYRLDYDYTFATGDVRFSKTAVTASSLAKSVSLQVAISGVDDAAKVVVDWASADGTATNGVDYATEGGSLVWEAGEKKSTLKTITVGIVDTGAWKGDRDFTVSLYPHKHCSDSEAVAACLVTIKEKRTRKPGKLAFDKTLAKGKTVVREGEFLDIPVLRTDGVDGVVTGVVTITEGKVKTERTIVWENGDAETKVVQYPIEPQEGIQQPMTCAISLKAASPAKTGTPSSAKFTRYDALYLQSFADYNKSVLESAASVSGDGWFYGLLADGETESLRSTELTKKGTSLSVKLAGPGVLRLTVGVGEGATADLSVAGKTVEKGISETGERLLAIPAGTKSVKLTASGSGAYAYAKWEYVPLKRFAYTPLRPFAGSCVRFAEDLAFMAVLTPGTEVPAFLDGALEWVVVMGSSAKTATTLSGSTPVSGGTDATFVPSVETLARLIGRQAYWRVDTRFTDDYGVTAVLTGANGVFQLIPFDSPFVDVDAGLPEGCSSSEAGFVTLPDLTVGVSTDVGPFAIAGADGASSVSVSVKNGKLPKGLKVSVADDGIHLVGVPTKAGAYAADLFVQIQVPEGKKKTVKVQGASIRIAGEVKSLGDVASTYCGNRIEVVGEAVESARGVATLTITAVGAVSGKVTLDGVSYTFKASSLSAVTNGTFYLSGVSVGKGKATLPLSFVLSLDDGVENDCDVVLKVGAATYRLYRSIWKETEGKALLAGAVGSYTAALPVVASDPEGVAGDMAYMTATVKAGGTVEYAGVDTLGRVFSGSSTILYTPHWSEARGHTFAFYVEARPKGAPTADAGLFGLVALVPDEADRKIWYLAAADDSGLTLSSQTPKSVREYVTWTNRMDIVGGTYDKSAALAVNTVWAQAAAPDLPFDYDGLQGESGYTLVAAPEGISLRAVAAKKVGFDASPFSLSAPSFASSTGSFSFTASLTYVNEAGKKKARKIAPKGLFVQRSLTQGSFWVALFGIDESVGYLNEKGRPATYKVTAPYSVLFK